MSIGLGEEESIGPLPIFVLLDLLEYLSGLYLLYNSVVVNIIVYYWC